MVEYSLAKAEVEGSSPFFRLSWYGPGLPLWFHRYNRKIMVTGKAGRGRNKIVAKPENRAQWLGHEAAWRNGKKDLYIFS